MLEGAGALLASASFASAKVCPTFNGAAAPPTYVFARSLDEATLPPDQLTVDVGADGTTCFSVRKGGLRAAGKASVLLSASQDGVLFDYLTVDVVAGSDYPPHPPHPLPPAAPSTPPPLSPSPSPPLTAVDLAMAMESNAMAPEIIAAIVVLLIVVPIVCVVGCICVFGKEKVASVVERSRRKRAPVSPLATGPFRRLSTMFGSSKSVIPDEKKGAAPTQLPAPEDQKAPGLTMIGV